MGSTLIFESFGFIKENLIEKKSNVLKSISSYKIKFNIDANDITTKGNNKLSNF
jgi:hypothetical protein